MGPRRAFVRALALALLAARGAAAQVETVAIEPAGRQKLEGVITGLAFTARGDSVAVTTDAGRVRLFDARGQGAGRDLIPAAARASAIVRSRDDARVVVGTERGEVIIADAAGGAPRVVRVGEPVTALALSASGLTVAVGLRNGEVALVAAATGEVTARLRGGHKKAVVHAGFLREGEALLTVGADRDIVYWDVKKTTQLRGVREPEPTITSAAATPSGDLLFVGTEFFQPPAFGQGQPSYKNTLAIYDVASAAPQKQLDLEGQHPAAIAGAPDCRHVAIALRDKRGSHVGLYDVERGMKVYDAPSAGRAMAVAFAPDGRTIAVGAEDGTVTFLAVRGVLPRPRCGADLRGVKFAITGPRTPLVQPSRRTTLALLAIADNGIGKDQAAAIGDLLLTRLARNPGVRLVERRKLDVILAEQQLAASGRVDPAQAVQLGRLFNMQKALTGSAARLGTTVTISVQLVDVETGQVQGTREVQCNACEDEDLTRAVSELAEVLVAEPAPGALPAGDPPYIQVESPRDGAEAAGATVTVRATIEHQAGDLRTVEVRANGEPVPGVRFLDPPTGKPVELGRGVRSVIVVAEAPLGPGTSVLVVRAVGADGTDAQRVLTARRSAASPKAAPPPARTTPRPKPPAR